MAAAVRDLPTVEPAAKRRAVAGAPSKALRPNQVILVNTIKTVADVDKYLILKRPEDRKDAIYVNSAVPGKRFAFQIGNQTNPARLIFKLDETEISDASSGVTRTFGDRDRPTVKVEVTDPDTILGLQCIDQWFVQKIEADPLIGKSYRLAGEAQLKDMKMIVDSLPDESQKKEFIEKTRLGPLRNAIHRRCQDVTISASAPEEKIRRFEERVAAETAAKGVRPATFTVKGDMRPDSGYKTEFFEYVQTLNSSTVLWLPKTQEAVDETVPGARKHQVFDLEDARARLTPGTQVVLSFTPRSVYDASIGLGYAADATTIGFVASGDKSVSGASDDGALFVMGDAPPLAPAVCPDVTKVVEEKPKEETPKAKGKRGRGE
jgi:hypothetical protein